MATKQQIKYALEDMLPFLGMAEDMKKSPTCGAEVLGYTAWKHRSTILSLLQSALDTQKPAGDAAQLQEALEFRKASYESAIAQRDAFYGMNKDRPVNHDNVIYEAAKAHLAALTGDCGGGDAVPGLTLSKFYIEMEPKYTFEACEMLKVFLAELSVYLENKNVVFCTKSSSQAITADNAKRGE